MIKTLFKWTFYAVLILCLGQIHVGGEPVATKIHKHVIKAWNFGKKHLDEESVITKFSKKPAVRKWIKQAEDGANPADFIQDKTPWSPPDINLKDQEALVGILDN